VGEWAPDHEAQGFEDKVNAAVVHGKRMFLFGEICAWGDGSLKRDSPEGPNWSTKAQASRWLPTGDERTRQHTTKGHSASSSNRWRERTEVSRGRRSRHPRARRGTAKGRTRTDKEER